MQGTNSRWWQLHKYDGEHLVNLQNGKCLDAKNSDTQNTALYWIPKVKKRLSNKWDLTYVDELKGEYKTGELNKEYGWIVNKDFYIVSQMPSRRFLTKIGSYGVGIKTRYE